ncbi:MAG TPA: alpha/beta hydrolase [Bryobacteraceae bacterium]|nr:alpha/beta hydrolase [Bryobacteraceae bacterium]
MRHLGNTPVFRLPSGEIVPGSIAEIRYYSIGGMQQWVMIRGESVANPVLVLVHGGPGFSEMRLFRHFNAELEKSFTIVYWDQRGTAKSFDPHIPASSMTVEQFIADLNELVDIVRERLGKDKVAIYGHSWGSALAVLYVARFPEKISVYAGAGQIGDWPASERICYSFTLAEAERRGNEKAVRELRAIGPPPHSARSVMAARTWLTRFVGFIRGMSLWKFSLLVISGPECSVFDLPNIIRGTRFSTETMWTEVSALDLTKAVPSLQVPVSFFLGRHDHVVAPETSQAYFDMLAAPQKELVWFEESAHEPPFEETARFNEIMSGTVRRIAAAAS